MKIAEDEKYWYVLRTEVSFPEIVLRTIRDEVEDFHIKMSIKALFMTEKYCKTLNV